MILVHELGHYLTWRNFGVPARLPFFIPGLGAFVSAPRPGTPGQNVAATLAGPLFGIGAAAACWGYAISTHDHFWIAAAYIGFFLNFFNLMPIPMLDGGAIAGAIDARLWLLGLPLFVAWAFFAHFSAFSLIFLLLIAFYALPQIVAVWRGRIDPRGSGLTTGQRLATAAAYFALALIAIGGAYATSHQPVQVA
jgi:Zn-dependent protease